MSSDVDRIVRTLKTLLVVVAVLWLVFLGGVWWTGYEGRVTIVDGQRAACRANLLDRADNAAGWTAHRDYIAKVTGAASVKEDVKTAAREASATYARISMTLTQRAAIDCDKKHPAASLLP